jgi:hypothetical protein
MSSVFVHAHRIDFIIYSKYGYMRLQLKNARSVTKEPTLSHPEIPDASVPSRCKFLPFCIVYTFRASFVHLYLNSAFFSFFFFFGYSNKVNTNNYK